MNAMRSPSTALMTNPIDPITGRRSPLTTITPRDSTGVFVVFGLTLADDPTVYAYNELLYRSSLFVVMGAR